MEVRFQCQDTQAFLGIFALDQPIFGTCQNCEGVLAELSESVKPISSLKSNAAEVLRDVGGG